MIEQISSNSYTRNFCLGIRSCLKSGLFKDHKNYLSLTGTSNLSHFGQVIKIDVDFKAKIYKNWLFSPPKIWVPRKYIWKSGDEWHCLIEENHASLCYCYEYDWQKYCSDNIRANGPSGAVKAAHYMLDHMRSLLWRHHLGRRYSLDNWCLEWGYRPHSKDNAKAEFESDYPNYRFLSQEQSAKLIGITS